MAGGEEEDTEMTGGGGRGGGRVVGGGKDVGDFSCSANRAARRWASFLARCRVRGGGMGGVGVGIVGEGAV